jgi:hypothetical protein
MTIKSLSYKGKMKKKNQRKIKNKKKYDEIVDNKCDKLLHPVTEAPSVFRVAIMRLLANG